MGSDSQLRTTQSPRAKRRQWRAMLTATGPLASSPTLRPARTPAKNGCRCGASLDQGSELRARIVLVRRANITRMRLMYGPELSCLSAPVRDRPNAAVGKISRQRRGQNGKADATFENPGGEPPHLQTRAFALSTLPP